jgi:hypothetical protein
MMEDRAGTDGVEGAWAVWLFEAGSEASVAKESSLKLTFSILMASFGTITACSAPAPFAELDVVGTDYAFLAPDSVSAGETAVSFRNAGRMRHEVKVIALRPNANLPEVLPLAMIDSGWAEYREPTSGILTADAGQTTPGRILVNFERGRTYLLVCAFADSDTSRIHSELGMIRPLIVR